jgi:hypothetical protein
MEGFFNILDQAVTLAEQSLWALLWASTAICLIALAFAALERAQRQPRNGGNGPGAAISAGEGRALGLTLMVLGAGGVVLCLVAWGAMFGDLARAFRLLVQRLRDVTDGTQLAILAVTIVSMVIFDIGAYKYLGSEMPASRSGS